MHQTQSVTILVNRKKKQKKKQKKQKVPKTQYATQICGCVEMFPLLTLHVTLKLKVHFITQMFFFTYAHY